MYKILLDEEDKLTTEILGKVIRKYQAETSKLFDNAQGYFDGRGQAIMKRVNPDASRPNNRIVKNYCKTIVENFQGYLTGNPIVYSGKDGFDVTELQEILDLNDVINEDSEFLRDALINGIAYELVYMNEDKEVKFKCINPKCVIPIYSNDLDEKLLYCVYYYPIQNWDDELAPQKWSVNVYASGYNYHYIASNEFNDFQLVDGETNWFDEVPFVIFDLNKQNTPIFEPIISLQDAYNSLLSDEVNDFEAFVDAYMVLKNLSADEEDLASMKANRTILVDGDSDVTYLTKDINDTQIQNLLDNINTSIHTVSNSPDFSSEEFNNGVSSGIALQFKLVGFNNIASNIEARFSKALQKRIWLINKMKKLIDTDVFLVDITFKHNLPTSILDTVNMVNSLRGLVSDETLLAQLPFVKDVDEELKRIHEADSYFLDEVAIEPVGIE